MKLPPAKISSGHAFTRLDWCCTVGMTVLLLTLGIRNFSGEAGRIFRCSHHLSRLGQAMQQYAAENDGDLPPASSSRPPATWDACLSPYLRPDFADANSAYGKRALRDAVEPMFLCPSDRLVRGRPRTYIMSGHDMQPENWPPSPFNTTGVGLAWNQSAVDKLYGSATWEAAKTNRQLLPPVKLAWLPEPANTLFLTELVHPNNVMGNVRLATLRGPHQQVDLFQGDRTRFHQGRFNYLMVDGHVECLAPDATGNAGAWDADQPADIWTIKAGD